MLLSLHMTLLPGSGSFPIRYDLGPGPLPGHVSKFWGRVLEVRLGKGARRTKCNGSPTEESSVTAVVVVVEYTNHAAQEFATVDSYHSGQSYAAVGFS